MGRAPCCDKANVKKGPWSPEEDLKLKDFIHKCGTGGNWIALPQKAGLRRCGKSCRLRWLNYLRPNIKHGEFSADEDRIICTLFSNIGSRWSIIASQMPGRTDNDIKNYWNTKLKKKLIMMNNSSSTMNYPPIFSHDKKKIIPIFSSSYSYPQQDRFINLDHHQESSTFVDPTILVQNYCHDDDQVLASSCGSKSDQQMGLFDHQISHYFNNTNNDELSTNVDVDGPRKELIGDEIVTTRPAIMDQDCYYGFEEIKQLISTTDDSSFLGTDENKYYYQY